MLCYYPKLQLTLTACALCIPKKLTRGTTHFSRVPFPYIQAQHRMTAKTCRITAFVWRYSTRLYQCCSTFNIDLEAIPPVLLLWVLATVCLKGGMAAVLHQALMRRLAPAVLIHALYAFLHRSPQAVFPVFWNATVYGDLKTQNKTDTSAMICKTDQT